MHSNYSYRTRSALGHPATSPSPLRHASTASSNSSGYSRAPSRRGNQSSRSQDENANTIGGHQRGISDATTLWHPPRQNPVAACEPDAANTYLSIRQSLRPASRSVNHSSEPTAVATPASTPKVPKVERSPASHGRSYSVDDSTTKDAMDGAASPPSKMRPQSILVSRSDSIRGGDRESRGGRRNDVHFNPKLEKNAIQDFQKSSTGYLKTLAKFDDQDLALVSRDTEVVGMHGRHRLKRSDSVSASRTTAGYGYGGRNWMDTQRQFLQAYEYLCHIGEAKDWIESIIDKPIPPIVQLEETLRDGVTLAEVVQALHPEKRYRIFRHERLQARHWDNIAVFRQFLAEIDFPDLFYFELVDLYDKKNIPKVIYCIHALSWLLFRTGVVDFKIGNLVGQLQFEDHELEATQKGLDKVGAMPNFSGMGASFGAEPEPEPEPVESEEHRINRELSDEEEVILELQAQIRGAMTRLRLGDQMQEYWDAENWIVALQAKIRGDFAREIFEYKRDMQRFAVALQAASRGFLVRSRARYEHFYWKSSVREVVLVQKLVRGRKVRAETRRLQTKLQVHEHGIRRFQAFARGALTRTRTSDDIVATKEAESTVQSLQAVIRGALARRNVADQVEGAQEASVEIVRLQAAARALLQRKAHRTDRVSLRQHQSTVTTLQAAARAFVARQEQVVVQKKLQAETVIWERLQAVARGLAVRREFDRQRQELHANDELYTQLQAAARASAVRIRTQALRAELSSYASSILDFQSRVRGKSLQRKLDVDRKALQTASMSTTFIQSAIRGYLQRGKTETLLHELYEHEEAIINLQSIARSTLCNRRIGKLFMELERGEESVEGIQCLIRGKLIRKQFAEKKKFYQENMKKVIKIQSFVRARQQGEAYKTLTNGKNPPVGIVKNFVHLLNDSDFDFDEEIEFERLRKTVVQQVRQNELAEQYIDQLDVKIALLVKNKITLDEVVKHQRHFGGHIGSLLTNKDIASKDPFDLKALNKNSRKKLELYQELFFTLQTQPQYLARLFRRLRERQIPEQESKRVELLMMGIFGFAQKRREEYYLLKVISRSIQEEAEVREDLQDYLRGNFFWSKLLGGYMRSPRHRKFLRDLLGPVIRENILDDEQLDLESDPMQIYKSAINNEELRTGQRSRRPADIPREQAIRDSETRETFIQRLQQLRDIVDHYMLCLEETLPKMPFGVRYIVQQMFDILCVRFPQEPPQHLLSIVGNWLWKSYIMPAFLQPDTWGVIDRGLSPLQKRNMGEVAKVVGQIAAGRLFGGENVYLQPINPYISEALVRIEDFGYKLIDVQPAEEVFDIDEFNDLYARQKPTLYMKLTDIFAVHQLVSSEMAYMCPERHDMLNDTLRELGSAKNNENDMLHVSSNEITLTLNPKFHDMEDPEAPVKALFMETKRCILYIIRVQQGTSLLDIMVRPITTEDEDKWDALVNSEILEARKNPRRQSNPYNNTSSALDITTLTYSELKRTALENILTLERTGKLSRANHYQDLLNQIALDIRTKHRRRVQRSREMDNVRVTLQALQEKTSWLDSQLHSYNDYIEQAMVTLQQKAKGKKRFLLPFTKQYNHERELARSGRVPRFGSFKYSARNLAEKGVLVAWRGYPDRQWDKLDLTISSDEVGVFHIEGSCGSMIIQGASASVPLDDLLQAQFNNCQFMNLFGEVGGQEGEAGVATREGPLRLNVNLLVHLLMRKFYRDAT